MTPLALSTIMLALALLAATLGRKLGEKLGDRQRSVYESSTKSGVRQTAGSQHRDSGEVSEEPSSTGGVRTDIGTTWMAKKELVDVRSALGASADPSEASSTSIGDKMEEDIQAYFEALGFVPVESTTSRVEGGEEERTLWEQYHQSGDPSARERLIVHYAPLVKYAAGRMSVSHVSETDYTNIVSYGIFGLMRAIETYNPDEDTRFEAYAFARIRSTILDELRLANWVREKGDYIEQSS